MKDLLDFHHKQGGIATIAVHKRKVRIDLGVVQSNDDFSITGYIEKPTYDYTVSMGIYVFEPRVLQYIPVDQYLDFPDLVLKLIAAGEKVVAYPFDGYWMDLGRPDDYQKANDDFSSMKDQFLLED
jgi:NDP-sugar pyrophosphorylase family protein